MSRVFDPDIWREVTGGAVAERVRRLTRVTPLVPAPALGRRTGADVWLKLENLQRTGSFKLRGAYVRIAGLLGRARTYRVTVSGGQVTATGYALSSKCDLLVAMARGSAAGDHRRVAELLESDLVGPWIAAKLGRAPMRLTSR